jgi:RNA polymerase sigma-70 factor (ECF subfamily)
MNPVEQITDEILVMDARNGDREAFDKLVSRWQKRLWRHALNLTGLTGAAWDISQESWLDIVRGLARLNDPARFGPWAYRIVSNKAHDWRCRRGREGTAPPEPQGAPAATGGPGALETACDIHDLLHRLSAPARTLLTLYYLEGFSLAEIAGILGTPEGTVKSRLHSARIEFRSHWAALGGKVTA